MPLKGAEMYGIFSQVMLGDKYVFLKNPTLVEDPRMTISVSMWGYMGYFSSAPSIHDIFTGHWNSLTNGELEAGFSNTSIINAALAVITEL